MTLPDGLGEYGLFLVIAPFDWPAAIEASETVKTAIDKGRIGTFIRFLPAEAGTPQLGD